MAKQAAIGLRNGLGQVKSFAHFFEFLGATHNISSLMDFLFLV
jgi:hypothetical protein